MRPLEWLVIISFVPIIVTPLVRSSWRRGWLLVATVLPVLACALHILVEGWRSQMAPLYLLAVLVVAIGLRAAPGGGSATSPRVAVLASAAIAVIVIGADVLAGWLLPVVSLPAPTGPYHVGVVDRELVDATRGRRLMASVWYPAAESTTRAPLTHNPDEVMAALGNLTGLPAPLFQHLRYMTVDASENAPTLAANTPFPVLVFSHGLVGMRLQDSSTLQDLASWGYVVVAVDHTDAAAVTVFPDGEARYYDQTRFGIPAGIEPDKATVDQRMFPVWVADQRFVYDTLATWNEGDPLFAGKLDLTRIGSFGHSFGGATALEVCRLDARCRAAVDMDGGIYGGSETLPASRPLMVMSSAASMENAEAVAGWRFVIEHATAPAYWMELPNSNHLSFTITELLSPVLAPPGFDPLYGLAVVDDTLRAFFDQQLRGVESMPLGPGNGSLDVRWLN
jgi:dienelactone hydrolase